MKRIFGVELSHQNAPLSVREKITLDKDATRQALEELKLQFEESFIISTCNRLSLYALSDTVEPLIKFFRQFGELDPYLAIFDYDLSAPRHLYATASGLESQAIGEHEILGQLKISYQLASETKSVGPIFNEFIRRAIYTGRKVRKETAIGQYPVSLASISLEIINDVYKSVAEKNILVIGTGEMANLMLKLLAKKPFGKLYIASKSIERASILARVSNGEAISIDKISDIFPDIDIIIGATQVDEPVLGRELVELLGTSKWKTFIDLGLPRNFDEKIKNLPGHKLYDLDDLKSMTYQSMQKRQEEIPKAMYIIEEELAMLSEWLAAREISPLISSYYEKLNRIQEEEISWALPKLGEFNEAQQKVLEMMVSRLTRRMSGKPIEMLKTFAQEPDQIQSPIHTFKSLFDL